MSPTAWKEQLKNATDFGGIRGALEHLKVADLEPNAACLISRAIQRLQSHDVRIGFLANYTLPPLPDYVVAHAALKGMAVSTLIGNYGQYMQEVLVPQSDLAQFMPDFVFCSLTLRRFLPELCYGFSNLTTQDKKSRLAEIVTHVSRWVHLALVNLPSTLLLANFVAPSRRQLGIADAKNEYSESEFYADLNAAIQGSVKHESRVQLVDADQLAAAFGKNHVFDTRMRNLADVEWHESFLPSLASEIWAHIDAQQGRARKCLVVDLDNTLWGGIVGEDGVSGIRIGDDDPVGRAYWEFQSFVRSLKDRGVLLAINSKNNEPDVIEAFTSRTEMPLTIADFAVRQVNWEPKHINLQRIADELNIGVDSLVFVDDNPSECLLIQQMLPEVLTIKLPEDPADYVDCLASYRCFEKIQVLSDDAKKTVQYLENRQRAMSLQTFDDLAQYLDSLETHVLIRSARPADVARILQLFTKTNQFNATTIRYSASEIERFLTNDDLDLRIVAVRDRFGDLGQVGLYLVRCEAKSKGQSTRVAHIDSFILSCRAMGRGIEVAMSNDIKHRYPGGSEDDAVVTARYIPTRKNDPVRNFFDEQGFEVTKQEDDGTKHYCLRVHAPRDCSWLHIEEGDE